MSLNVQIVMDCSDPHRQARFWAEAAGLQVEDVEPGIRKMLDAGYATEADVVEVDGALVWREAAACSDPSGRLPRMYFQAVPEPKQVKDRIHVDLQVGAHAREAEVTRLTALGATKLYDGTQGPHTWVTMADPEGNEFCVA